MKNQVLARLTDENKNNGGYLLRIYPVRFLLLARQWVVPSLFAVIIFLSCLLIGYRAEAASELSPVLIVKLHRLELLAKKENIQFKVICGYRSPKEQARLYAQGRTKPGKKVTWVKHSKHNDGLAVDIAVLKNGKITWQGKDYLRIGALGQKLGLVWGGAWKARDYGHFEVAQ